ncbi:signal peptidase I [Acetivibrio mesophilus]|uniref:Signal peptidase I n=1 Tax=Acetivibrio mesophilus TaxID=2487273 RepID=A0A4Q0I0X0_9FIRM|nr:signal peptidase I [Acetivibrio mesophilus]ODM24878.1 signal peptidase I [Clostridium sp. Bc-iso-3]RXE57866.1 signal peptidase I [Acetivibrio mesophilus]HHV30057.1 signal peptidase I [Clostridium sp.]
MSRGGIITKTNQYIREALDWAGHIIIAVLIGLFIVTFVAQITIVNGSSMETTLHDGDRLIIEKISPRFGWLKRGDIVTINDYPGLDSDRKPLIKRVIGLEGDKVEIRDGKVYVNGEVLEEDYINVDAQGTLQVNVKYSELSVPDGHIYVLGDNRLPGQSKDSRTFGTIDIKNVGGKAIFRFFPFTDIGTLK